MPASSDDSSNLGWRLALTQPWWMWKDRPIREALAKVRLSTWLPVIQEALARNGKMGRNPARYRDLQHHLDRDFRNLERLESGEHKLTDQVTLGFSLALEVPVCRLIPEARAWVAEALCELCQSRVSLADASAYVAYRLAAPRYSNPHLDPEAVQKVAVQLASSFRGAGETGVAIERAVKALGSVLAQLSKGNHR